MLRRIFCCRLAAAVQKHTLLKSSSAAGRHKGLHSCSAHAVQRLQHRWPGLWAGAHALTRIRAAGRLCGVQVLGDKLHNSCRLRVLGALVLQHALHSRCCRLVRDVFTSAPLPLKASPVKKCTAGSWL